MSEDRVPRRAFLTKVAVGAVAAAGAALPSAPAAAGGRYKRVYRLDPEWGTGEAGCGSTPHKSGSNCHGCKACHKHAANKLFPNARTAGNAKHRAHKYCKCEAFRGPRITKKKWKKLFVKPDGTLRPSVDRRDPRVRRILNL